MGEGEVKYGVMWKVGRQGTYARAPAHRVSQGDDAQNVCTVLSIIKRAWGLE